MVKWTEWTVAVSGWTRRIKWNLQTAVDNFLMLNFQASCDFECFYLSMEHQHLVLRAKNLQWKHLTHGRGLNSRVDSNSGRISPCRSRAICRSFANSSFCRDTFWCGIFSSLKTVGSVTYNTHITRAIKGYHAVISARCTWKMERSR